MLGRFSGRPSRTQVRFSRFFGRIPRVCRREHQKTQRLRPCQARRDKRRRGSENAFRTHRLRPAERFRSRRGEIFRQRSYRCARLRRGRRKRIRKADGRIQIRGERRLRGDVGKRQKDAYPRRQRIRKVRRSGVGDRDLAHRGDVRR